MECRRRAGPRRARLRWLVSFLLTIPAAGEASPTGAAPEGPGIDWAADWDSALEQAQVEGRLIMVDFWTTWCGWCKRLDRETYADPRVIERCGKFVAVKVDGDRQRDLARTYRVTGYPTIGFLHPDGRSLQMVVGFQSADHFVATLDRLLDRKGEEFILRQRLKDHPELVDVRADLASLLAANGRAGEAVAHLDTLLAERDEIGDERYWDLSLARGKALLALGKPRDARRPLKEFVKHRKESPRFAEALYLLGEACLTDGDRKEARKCFKKLLDVRTGGWLAEESKERLTEMG